MRRLFAAFLLLASPAAAELDLDGVTLTGGTLHMQARITAGGHTRTNDQHNIWSGSAWTADTPTGTLDEGSMQLTGHMGNEPVIRRVARWPSTSPNTSTNRLILNSVGGDADGIMDYFSASAGLTIIHEDSAGTITQASTQGAPSGMNNSFVDWRDDGGNPLGDEMWALINSVVAGDSLILVAHAGGTVTYTQPSEPTWAGKYQGTTIGEGKYNGATITAAKFNGVAIITGTSTPVTPITGVVVDAGADQTVASGSVTAINATVTLTNPSGTTTYAWTRVSGTGGSLSSTTVEDPSFTAPTLSAGDPDRVITWRLTATNNSVSGSDDITFTVEAPAPPPVTTVTVDAGHDHVVASGTDTAIDATVTVTNGVGATTLAWTRVSGTGGSLSSTTTEDPTFTAPTVAAGDPAVTIEWRLTATNNSVSANDDVAFIVEPTHPADHVYINGIPLTVVDLGSGHWRVHSNGNFPTGAGYEIPASLMEDNAAEFLRSVDFRSDTNNSALTTRDTDDVSDTSGGDLTRDFEEYDAALRLHCCGHTVVWPGPDYTGNNIQDGSEPYSFRPGALRPELSTFLNNVGTGTHTFSITLRETPTTTQTFDWQMQVLSFEQGGETQYRTSTPATQAGVSIDTDLRDDTGAAAWFRRLELRGYTDAATSTATQIVQTHDTQAGSAGGDGPDLSNRWERASTAITVTRGANTVTVPAPNATGSSGDTSEPYEWTVDAASRNALNTFLGNVLGSSPSGTIFTFTVTLSDG